MSKGFIEWLNSQQFSAYQINRAIARVRRSHGARAVVLEEGEGGRLSMLINVEAADAFKEALAEMR